MENLVSYDVILSSISNNLFPLSPLTMIGLGDACDTVNQDDCYTFTCSGTDFGVCSAGSE